MATGSWLPVTPSSAACFKVHLADFRVWAEAQVHILLTGLQSPARVLAIPGCLPDLLRQVAGVLVRKRVGRGLCPFLKCFRFTLE